MRTLLGCQITFRLQMIALLVSLFAGCASPVTAPDLQPVATDRPVQACMHATGAREMLLVEVPAAGKGLANQLSVLALKSGPSTTSETLSRLLTTRTRPVLLVHGDSPALTAATLDAALDAVPANGSAGQLPVCVAGLIEGHKRLMAKAQGVGFNLIVVPQP